MYVTTNMCTCACAVEASHGREDDGVRAHGDSVSVILLPTVCTDRVSVAQYSVLKEKTY